MQFLKKLYHLFKSTLRFMPIFFRLLFSRRKIVLFQTPLHGNIGDQAITLAEYKFFNDFINGQKVIEIPSNHGNKLNSFLLKFCIRKEDLLLIHGGGFLGTLWLHEEYRLQRVLTNLSDRRIIIMPNTVYYENDAEGMAELEKAIPIYKNCKNLSVFLREKYSYDYFTKHFEGVKAYLVPDIVLYNGKYKLQQQQRQHILLCLRNDLEKTQDVGDYIKKELEFLKTDFVETDMYVGHGVFPKERIDEVNKKMDEFCSSKLVITDRLHAMIFAAITETPCVVILSKSHKVKGVYQWIKHLNYIKLVENLDTLKQSVEEVLQVSQPCYDNSEIKKEFKKLVEVIKGGE